MSPIRSVFFALLLLTNHAVAQGTEPAPATPAPKPAGQEPAPGPAPTKETDETKVGGYVPYRAHDVSKIVRVEQKGDQRTMSIHAHGLHEMVEDLFAHARNYPPSFGEEKERAIAVQESEALSQLLATALGNEQAKIDLRLLLDAARLELCAHNLDLEGAATRARGYFERILKADPEHAEAHLHYGIHLVGLPGGAKGAIPHLELARDKGQKEAIRGLGMAYLMLQDREKALLHLRAWAKEFEGDVGTAQLIEALEDGANIEVHQVEGDEKAEKSKPGEEAKPTPKPGSRRDG